MIVLDTNVLSELMKPSPSPEVLHWFATQSPDSIFTTAITQAEILFGIELLPKGKRRDALHAAAMAMFDQDFAGRVLPFDSAAATAYSRIAASRQKAGRPISHFDAQIAAIALCHGAALTTRNTADFEKCGLRLVNPWAA